MGNNWTIWTLNAASDLIIEEDLVDMFDDRVTFGDRSNFNKDFVNEKNHNLMPMIEYFVPIAVKVLGSRIKDPLLKDAKEYFYNIWKKDQKRALFSGELYQSFWEISCGPDTKKKETSSLMVTKDFIGYYDILLESKKKTGRSNILVGYSQGGLVARYIAWLDEYIYKENIVDAVITVQSPNWGSPLANPANAEFIINNLITALLSSFSFYRKLFPKYNEYLQGAIDFYKIKELLLLLKDDLEKILNENSNALILYDLILTIIKWLSGLDKDSFDTAFFDLNMKNLNDEFSVLSSVNKNKLQKIKYASIISTNNEVKDSIVSFINEMKNFKCIVKSFFLASLKQKFLLGYTFEENFKEATKIYNNLLKETNLSNQISDIYISGIKVNESKEFIIDKDIKPYSHDFVIPSSYQLLENSKKKNYLGNFINDKANHNSGKSIDFLAGIKNSNLIYGLLKKIVYES